MCFPYSKCAARLATVQLGQRSRAAQAARCGHHRAGLFDAREDRRKGDHVGAGSVGKQSGDGGLATPRRAPEDQRRQLAIGQKRSDDSPLADQRLLANDIIEGPRPHPFRERADRRIVGEKRRLAHLSAPLPSQPGGALEVQHTDKRRHQ